MTKPLFISALIIFMALCIGCRSKKPMEGGGNPIPGDGQPNNAERKRPKAKKDSVVDEDSGKAAPAPFVEKSNPNVIAPDSGKTGFNEDRATGVPAAPPSEGNSAVIEEPLLGGRPAFDSLDEAARRARLESSGGPVDPSTSGSATSGSATGGTTTPALPADRARGTATIAPDAPVHRDKPGAKPLVRP